MTETGGAIKTNTYDDKVHGRGWGLDESERKNMMKKALWGSLAPDCMCIGSGPCRFCAAALLILHSILTVCNITVQSWLQLEMKVPKVRTDVSTVDDIHRRRLNFIYSLDELLQAGKPS
jgi:hypothetical protein